MSNKQKTALQQFIENICYFDNITKSWRLEAGDGSDMTPCIEQFKELEKQQIIDAYQFDRFPCSNEDAEQYYKEIFKEIYGK